MHVVTWKDVWKEARWIGKLNNVLDFCPLEDVLQDDVGMQSRKKQDVILQLQEAENIHKVKNILAQAQTTTTAFWIRFGLCISHFYCF